MPLRSFIALRLAMSGARRIPRRRLAAWLVRRRLVVLALLQLVQWAAVLLHASRHSNESSAFVWLCVLVGLPVALSCVYRLAAVLGGHRLGAFAGFVWVAAPFAVIPLYDPRYRFRYQEEILPRAVGLTESGEFPAMVLLLVAALFVVRALRGGSVRAAVAAGMAGTAAMVDAAALLLVPAALAALVAARRPRQAGTFALGLAPALVVVLARGTGKGLEAGSWDDLAHNFIFVREFFYSLRVLEWLPIAGAIAIARRSPPAAVLVAGWFFAFLAIQGSSSDVLDGSFYRVMLPALPAYCLLAASIPLLAPAPRRFRETVLVRRGPVVLVALALGVALVPAPAGSLPAPTCLGSARQVEVCTAYRGNAVLGARVAYYKFGRSENAARARAARFRLESRFQGRARQAIVAQVARWPRGEHEVDLPGVDIVSVRVDAKELNAVLVTRETWFVKTESNRVLFSEVRRRHVVDMRRV
ncbi:MAG: hypothetical protein ABR521_10530 [Gaiellaceae bacterium]